MFTSYREYLQEKQKTSTYWHGADVQLEIQQQICKESLIYHKNAVFILKIKMHPSLTEAVNVMWFNFNKIFLPTK